MTSVLNSKLMKDTLGILKDENDYVAQAILGYLNESNKLREYLKNNIGKETDVAELLRINKSALDSSTYLTNILKNEIKNYPKNLKDEKDFNTLVLVYLKENILKFCNNQNTVKCYKELEFFIDKNIKNIELNALAAITLRALKIIKDLETNQEYSAIEKFIKMLNSTKGYINNNIIYIIYFGLNLKEQTYEQRNESYNDDNGLDFVINSILNDESMLPDSIIKHLCSDNQFKDCHPSVLAFMINKIFMYTGYMGYQDYSVMIKKILKNDLEDWDEEAVFFDIKKLYDMIYEMVINEDSELSTSQILSDIKCDNLVFYEVEEDSYGSV